MAKKPVTKDASEGSGDATEKAEAAPDTGEAAKKAKPGKKAGEKTGKKKAGTKKTGKKAAKKSGKKKRGKRRGRPTSKWTLLTPAKLRAYLEEHGLRQKGLADMLGVSAQTVGNWTSGSTAPGEDTQRRLADMIRTGTVPTADTVLIPAGPGVTQQLKRLTPETSPEWLSADVAATCSRLARELLELAQRAPYAAANLNKAAALVLQLGADNLAAHS